MEDINISRESEHPEIIEESKENHNFLPYAFAVLILIGLVIAILFAYQFVNNSKTGFNIPTDTNHVILFDIDTLYSFEPLSGELNELGVFKVENIKEAVISSDLSNILLASDKSLSRFTSYKEGGIIATHDESIKNIAISSGELLFSSGELTDKNERKIYSVINNGVKIFGIGTTPFFLDGGLKEVLGTSDGFKIFDLENGDVLDTETPEIPIAIVIQPSKSGSKLALVSENGGVHIYSVLSTRPLSLNEDYFVVVPGVYDAAVSDDGTISYLRIINNSLYISVYDPNAKKLLSEELELSSNTSILMWSK